MRLLMLVVLEHTSIFSPANINREEPAAEPSAQHERQNSKAQDRYFRVEEIVGTNYAAMPDPDFAEEFDLRVKSIQAMIDIEERIRGKEALLKDPEGSEDQKGLPSCRTILA